MQPWMHFFSEKADWPKWDETFSIIKLGFFVLVSGITEAAHHRKAETGWKADSDLQPAV